MIALPAGLGIARPSGSAPAAWDVAVAALSPVLWLKLDDVSGGMLDSSGNAYNGTIAGALTRGEPPVYTGSSNSAKFGISAGANDFVRVGDDAALQLTGDLTILVLYKRSGTQDENFPKLLWKPTVVASGRMNYGLFYEKSTNKVYFRVNASSTAYTAISTTAFADNTAYMFTGRRLGTEVAFFNGTSKEATATLPSSGTALDTTTDDITIGGHGSTNSQANAWISDALVFNYALSDSEIAGLVTAHG